MLWIYGFSKRSIARIAPSREKPIADSGRSAERTANGILSEETKTVKIQESYSLHKLPPPSHAPAYARTHTHHVQHLTAVGLPLTPSLAVLAPSRGDVGPSSLALVSLRLGRGGAQGPCFSASIPHARKLATGSGHEGIGK